MTYGENAGAIREALIALLQHHRIQQRLGGPGTYTVGESTTLAEREELGATIQRYRDTTLTWCHLALEATSPKNDVSRGTPSNRSPVEELRFRLDRTQRTRPRGAEEGAPPLVDLLTVTHEFELMGLWQQVARAAALGEHDFTADVSLARLTGAQAATVTKDAADVVRGVLVLDQRYSNIPGWRHIPDATRLSRAADEVSRQLASAAQDLSVDAHGWRPPPEHITQPALRGVEGAVQAERNMLVNLAECPNALNLRRLLHAQAQASYEAAEKSAVNAPELAKRFFERAQVYRTLVAQSRNLGGLVGDGGPAVAESQNAVARLRQASNREPGRSSALHELQRLFSAADARLATIIERGLNERLYFVSVKVPRMTDHQVNGVFQPRERWMPVTCFTPTDLLPSIREQLRPAPPPPPPTPPQAAQARTEYEAVMAQQPPVARNRSPSQPLRP
jgi:hypothetical protein